MRDDGLFICRDLPETPSGIRRLSGEEVMNPPPSIISVQVSHADAYLIAAAPELYTEGTSAVLALNEAAAIIQGFDLPGTADIFRAHANRLNTILKKARGEA